MSCPDDEQLADILAKARLQPVFQPIVDISRQCIHGYEALIRGPADSPLQAPRELFAVAVACGRLVELDLLCRKLAIERFVQLDLPGKLFLNIIPHTIIEHDFRGGVTLGFLEAAGLSPQRVVIELTEHEPIDDYGPVCEAVAHYREMGFQVALDDLGAGYSSLRHWSEIRPDFVKLDRHFVSGIDACGAKREFLRTILDTARTLNCRLIAEGIETEAEHQALWEIDRSLSLLQGFYFARPSAHPPTDLEHFRLSAPVVARAVPRQVAGIARPVEPVPLSTRVIDLASRFRRQPGLRCVAILDDGIPVGLVRRNEFLTLFVNPYSHALFDQRTIGQFVDRNPVIVHDNTPLEVLSQMLTEGQSDQQDFIVADGGGRYLGVGNIIDLLREMTSLRIREARHANPLTGLPGNLLINDAIDARLAGSEPCVVAYADLDNFKAFNDANGYEAGDRLILALAALLQDHVQRQDEFVGHVGGDDFIFIMGLAGVAQRCTTVLKAFERLAIEFYTPEQRERGGLMLADRRGQETFYPLVSLSIAALPLNPNSELHRLDVTSRLSELKQQAKRIPGNSFFIERRHPTPCLDSSAPGAERNATVSQPRHHPPDIS